MTQNPSNETILVDPTPTPTKWPYQESEDVPSPTLYRGPDLRSMLGADCGSELDKPCEAGSGSSLTASPTPSPDTPEEGRLGDSPVIDVDGCELDLEVDEEQRSSEQSALRTKAVMDGWRRKWALRSLQAEKSINSPKVTALGSGALRAANLRRTETTVIMADPPSKRSEFYKPPKSAPSKISAPSVPKPRKGKLVFESTKVSSTALKASKSMASVTSSPMIPKPRLLVQ